MQNHRHPRRRCFLLFATTLIFFARGAEADDWPQWRGPQRDGVWREDGIVISLPEEQIPIKWRTPIGPGYSGPTVANGQVLVTDRIKEPEQIERIHCFAESDGTKVWTVEYACPYVDVGYEAGPRASVTIDNHVAYSLGTMGHLHAIDSQTGNVIWKRQLQEDYQISMPIWGIAAAPLIYQDLIIVHIGGADGACIVALNKQTGNEVWKALNDKASYSAPIIIQQNQQDVLICWTGDNVAALDPSNGQVHWTSPMPPSRMVIGIATPVVEDNRIFVTSFYDGSKMVQFEPNSFTATELWRSVGPDEKNTRALHSIISTPIMKNGHIYGVDSYGELRCLNAQTGERIWEDQTATPRNRWSNIHMVQHGDDVWMFNEAGELIIAQLSPDGYHEKSRSKLIEPTLEQLRRRDGVCWAHPAFANRHVFARNDKELVCASLAEPTSDE